ncbi:MAG: FkbM family methyltransferase [Woeseiaceae bacterium]
MSRPDDAPNRRAFSYTIGPSRTASLAPRNRIDVDLEALKNRINRKLYRREHRRHVQQWWADGGDDRFRFDYDLGPDSLVLGLGGYEGQWASDIYGRYRCRVRIFEPVSRYADNIRRRFARNGDIEVFPFGLGKSTRSETLYIRGAGSSIYGKKAEAEEIRIVDVADWFAAQQPGRVDLMKINIEGGEFELLERMLDTGLTKRVRDIQVQFHNISFGAERRMERIKSRLAETHVPAYQYKFVWENWTRKDDS